MNVLRETWLTLRDAGFDWLEDKCPTLGAALAFYSVLSLAPLLMIVIAGATFIFGEEAARGQVVEELRGLIGREGAMAIEAMIDNSQRVEFGSTAALVGVAVLLIGASGVFVQLQEALNIVWEVPPRVGFGIWAMIKDRFLSFGLVLGSGFLLLVSLVLSAAIAGLGKYLGETWPGLESTWHLLDSIITWLMATLLFALIFKLLPDKSIAWRDVWFGAAITALLFTLGKFLIGLYLGKSGIASAYGAGGSLVILVLWLYYSAQILLFGAELTHVCARRYGSLSSPRGKSLPYLRSKRSSTATSSSSFWLGMKTEKTGDGRKGAGTQAVLPGTLMTERRREDVKETAGDSPPIQACSASEEIPQVGDGPGPLLQV